MTSNDPPPQNRDIAFTTGPTSPYLRSRRAGRGIDLASISYIVSSSGAGLSNLAFSLVVSRMLGPSQYGALTALLNLIIFLIVPLSAAGAAVVQAASVQVGGSIRKPLMAATGTGLVAATVAAATAPLLDGFLHLGSAWPVLLTAAWLIPSVASVVPSGVLAGRLRFARPAAAQIAGALTRLGAGAALVAAGFGVSGAVAGSLVGAVVTFGVLLWGVRHEVSSVEMTSLEVRSMDVLRSAAAASGLWLLLGLDGIWARHYLGPVAAGNYTAADTAARAALFLPAAITSVVFPRLTAVRGAGAAAARALSLGAAAVGVIAGLVAALMALFPHSTVELVFGHRFALASRPLGMLAVAAAATALVNLLMYALLARRSWAALLPWGAVAAMSVAIALYHPSPQAIAEVVLVVTVILLGTMIVTAVPAVTAPR